MSDITPFSGGTNQENDSPKVKIKYPYNWVQSTSAGHMFEMNNTEDGEYIRLLNANGNFLNIDEKNNNNLVSYNDTYILSDHNLVIKVGKDVNSDRMALHIIGDVNLYVEGDMHSEVEGDRFDRVNGNYQMQVGGVCTIQSDENMAIQAKNEMKLQSNAYTNKTVFLENDLSEGGSVKENVAGNYEIKILKGSSTFSINSNGDIRSRAQGCRYEYTLGNQMNQIVGRQRTLINGGKPLIQWDTIINEQGSGRTAGTYNITATGGSPTKPAKFRVRVDAEGVTTVTYFSLGQGYNIGDVITLPKTGNYEGDTNIQLEAGYVIVAGIQDCIKGGAFPDMIDTIDYFNTEKLDVGGNISHHATDNYFVDSQDDTYIDAGGNINITAEGNVDIDGTEIYLN